MSFHKWGYVKRKVFGRGRDGNLHFLPYGGFTLSKFQV